MTYQALARKYRPRSFEEIVGQEHVVKALSNAFSQERVHHALLFSGTRGVGKTTLARIIAKCLNDESGVTATPDLEGEVSQAIEAGRFIDLIEVDAASRTGVDDTREMLDNVQYAPTQGRYKVYLIDEVHMFSKHSFNALLKTLEEPPPHVQFLLATTDPQKLPVTILSRCLQFHLRRLTMAEIAGQLGSILEKEGVKAEAGAVTAVAAAADGSMRDALSLLDQAISHAGGKALKERQVREMLGIIDRQDVLRLIEALAEGDGTALMQAAEALDEKVPDYDAVLTEMAAALQQIAMCQTLPESGAQAAPAEKLSALAQRMPAETVQLDYEIACTARRNLDWAPSHRLGFQMALLRMLAFRPDTAASAPAPPGRSGSRDKSAARPTAISEPAAGGQEQAARQGENAGGLTVPGSSAEWQSLVEALALTPAARELARNCVFESCDGENLRLRLPEATGRLLTERARGRLTDAVASQIADAPRLQIRIRDGDGEAPAQVTARQTSDRQRTAEQAIAGDPTYQELQKRFGAEVDPDSIQPL